MKTLLNIQGLRGIAVLLVVLTHILPSERKYSISETILPYWLDIGASGVDLFFVISGFVMVFITNQSFQSTSFINRFIFRRFARIYPLYWFYSFIVLIVWINFPHMVNNSQNNQANILESFLLLPQNINPLLMVGWTLIYEIYFYIIFALLMFLPRKNLFEYLLIWIFLIFLASFFTGYSNSYYEYYLGPMVVEFILGCILGILFLDGKKLGNPITIGIIGIISWFIGHLLLYPEGRGWERVIIYGIPALMITYSAISLEKDGNLLPLWLRKIGDASYSIYLSHVLVLALIGRIWKEYSVSGYIDNFFIILIMLISCIFFGTLSYKYLEIPLISIVNSIKFPNNRKKIN